MEKYDYALLIVGTGPAGMTAALYGQRLGLDTVVFGDIPGGNTYMIENLENFPGFLSGVPGTQFGLTAFQQAQQDGAVCPLARLESLVSDGGSFIATDTNGTRYTAPSAIIASGRVPIRLAVKNAQLKGAHFCSICDGPLYRGKDAALAVVGSDNAAAQHALSLARIASRVLLICRSDGLKMDAVHQKQIQKLANIDLMTGTEVTAYQGLDQIESIVVTVAGGPSTEIPVDGLFLAVGWRPNTKMLKISVDTTSEGYLKTDTTLMTSCPGLFAAGDVRDTDMWQVLTACADGARAAKHSADYIQTRNGA